MQLIELNAENIGLYLDELLEIEQEAFVQPWTRADYLAEAEREMSHLLAVVEDGRLLAYADFWQIVDEADINNVAVAQDKRGLGIGRYLMLAVLDLARKCGCLAVNLEVRAGNAAAIALYCGCGFAVSGRRIGYYADNGEDALLMRNELD